MQSAAARDSFGKEQSGNKRENQKSVQSRKGQLKISRKKSADSKQEFSSDSKARPSSESKNVDSKHRSGSESANEPRRQSKQKKGHVHQIERRSLIDVIKFALQQTERVTFLHRLTYVGQHSFKDSGEGSEELDSIFQTSVNLVNEDYCSEPITGCFIYYSKYFIHIVEGSEDAIGHHVKLIVEQIDRFGGLFGTVKIILQSHHIRRRYFGAWFSMYGVPRTLIDKISGDNEMEMSRQLENFYKKIVDIASYLEKRDSEMERGSGNTLNQKTLALLPEITLLEFLLKIDALENLHDYLDTYQHYPHLKMYEDYCWPPIMDFVPYNLYHELPDLSKLVVPTYHPKEEVEVEERAKATRVKEEEKIKKKDSLKDSSKSLLDVLKSSDMQSEAKSS